jgi:quercetin 2,3-dioxygenase
MQNSAILAITPITFRLDLKDPFIFTAHHIDHYPKANSNLGPATPAQNKEFNMYYGDVVPGFPEHPHTGFETITLVEQGYVDHFDSLGNGGRYAAGDVQWLSTGNGVEHCEMFPLLHEDKENPFELFQIWFNSSPEQKTKDADYKMFWREKIPHVIDENELGLKSDVRVISGHFRNTAAISRPQHSWAAAEENKVNIYLIHLEAGSSEARILWLEGEPIGAPVAMRGPFVLNSNQELDVAFKRYRETHFGQWPWPNSAPVFTRETPRFATYKGGEHKEFPEQF